jgi:hypothetical protein
MGQHFTRIAMSADSHILKGYNLIYTLIRDIQCIHKITIQINVLIYFLWVICTIWNTKA